ncbi:MAG: EutP/PduV family microcompartment system protein [Clostridiaceae bacterium]|nr:EutP/PduV family microcompartment system protein [Clostridiaceae bacterium]MBW4860860.1 EutP/PduV family microcompartment system protein [Clostridiaceae bacterium]MBW4867485.1 EutP/PduV family microcompartment system protein [Clostridiaceae bacterium]
MKKIMLIGETGSGKTTLKQALNNEEIRYKKTQSLEYSKNILDTPGEYIENRRYYNALMISSVDCDIIGLVQDCTSEKVVFPPNFTSIFNKGSIGIITKVDCHDADVKIAEKHLKQAGVEDIFYVDSITGEGIEDIRELLE